MQRPSIQKIKPKLKVNRALCLAKIQLDPTTIDIPVLVISQNIKTEAQF